MAVAGQKVGRFDNQTCASMIEGPDVLRRKNCAFRTILLLEFLQDLSLEGPLIFRVLQPVPYSPNDFRTGRYGECQDEAVLTAGGERVDGFQQVLVPEALQTERLRSQIQVGVGPAKREHRIFRRHSGLDAPRLDKSA